MSEELLLKWNDHHSVFFIGALDLCELEEYTDVTLAAGNKFFSAHKLVLSICSPYFRQLFQHLGKDRAVIFLKDVEPNHLDLLLQYMYKGEIKVQESELANFLNAAQALEVKGLCEKKDPKPRPASGPHHHSLAPTSVLIPPVQSGTNALDTALSKPGQSQQGPTELYRQENSPVKNEIAMVEHQTVEQVDDDVPDYGAEMVYSDSTVVAGYEESHGNVGWDLPWNASATGTYICKFCGKEFTHMSDLSHHMPVHTKEKNFECKGCGRRFTQSSSLYRHMKSTACAAYMMQPGEELQ